ncbi:segregation/condensation protein A [Thalassobacillus pellis]|uniref:segregation/condensation protein A n=1 Tax=Thalassobacillus pellis TaxID=748008 RepID=UPI0019611481|nr:segregation/condensation protein A [Thalassobacillus pellis]MBM7552410.1 segregation and condensation protein A [Thalassobacillus pellis]
MKQSYQVKVDAFEGPLDLLLHLINQYEIDIYDIPVADITEQYMAFIKTMQQLELDIASEYLVMAATLLAIKSQMLLPNQPVDLEDEEEIEDDPRDELMRRLIEYRRYKSAAGILKEKEEQADRIFTRPPSSMEEYMDTKPEIRPGEASIFDMIGAMEKLLQRKTWVEPKETTVQRDEIPIQTRMTEILDHISEKEDGTKFNDLFPQRSKPHVVVTFMALLELMKGNEIYCVQEHHFDELIVYKMEETP